MAEAKKKTTSKKSAAKKAPIKKEVSQKTTSQKVVKKNEATKKTVEAKKTPVKATPKKSMDWKTVSITLGIIAIVLIAFAIILAVNKNNKATPVPTIPANNSSISTGNSSSVPVSLLVINDPTCKNCQQELSLAAQLKSQLIPNLKINEISINTPQGKALANEMNLKFVPAFIFSKSIDQRSDWASLLKQHFNPISVGNTSAYMLQPESVLYKVSTQNITTLPNAIVVGNKSAKVTMYEFSDFECPYCGIAEGNTVLVNQFKSQVPSYVAPIPEIYKNYIDTGKLKLVYYNMPLENRHPYARLTHNAALCANEQGQWVPFKTLAYMNRTQWIGASNQSAILKSYASKIGLNMTEFDSCFDSKKYDSQITREQQYGASLGVTGTPAFFIGRNFISGAQNYSMFKSIIDSQLNATK